MADTFFYYRFVEFLSTVLKVDIEVTEHWFRFEYQHRGSPHVHRVVWVRGAPNILDLSTPEKLLAAVEFFDRLLSADNPGIGLPPAEAHPCRVNDADIVDEELYLGQLLNRVQRHTQCKPSYCWRVDKFTGKEACRFGFPKEMRAVSEFITNSKGYLQLQLARNDILLNSYVKGVPESWKGNSDGTPIDSLQGLLRYIAKYTTKSETRSRSCAELMNCVMDDLPENAERAIQSLFIKTVSDRTTPHRRPVTL